MTKEQLEQGNRLNDRIELLNKQLDKWNGSAKLKFIDLRASEGFLIGDISIEYVDFEILKTITIAKIKKELNEAKDKLKKL